MESNIFQVTFSKIKKVQSSAIHTSVVRNDIDSAAKYIGAGAATVGVAGAGKSLFTLFFVDFEEALLNQFC